MTVLEKVSEAVAKEMSKVKLEADELMVDIKVNVTTSSDLDEKFGPHPVAGLTRKQLQDQRELVAFNLQERCTHEPLTASEVAGIAFDAAVYLMENRRVKPLMEGLQDPVNHWHHPSEAGVVRCTACRALEAVKPLTEE